MKYCLQDKNHNLGNFINCTPTLKYLSDQIKAPFPVYFQTDYVKQCFLDCGFIKILERPGKNILFTSGEINKTMPDWQYIFMCNQIPDPSLKIPWTYVDRPPIIKVLGIEIGNKLTTFPRNEKYYVLIRGSGNDKTPGYSQLKDPGEDIYNYIIDKIPLKSVFVGSKNDEKYRKVNANETHIGDIRQALGIINGAEFVIANDSGLYHAAGAMKKKGFIMWKDTLFEKNRSPNDFMYSFDWQKDFDKWIKDK